MAEVNLGTTINYTVQPVVTKELTTVTVIAWVDRSADKIVVARLKELSDPIVLWSGAAYDAIGDWTEAQAQAQLKTVLTTAKS